MRDPLFDPPVSTFEPTRKDRNVEAVNIIPGEDTTYFDFRILPNYNAEQILADAYALAHDTEKRTGATIKIEKVQETIAPKPTSPNAPVAIMLKEALEKARGLRPRIGGIGGGTCAAYFRKEDIPAVVWCTVDEVAHQPNEYAKIQNLIDDAKIFALMATS
jgi:succinyl-diaminopimelate desuccinylase